MHTQSPFSTHTLTSIPPTHPHTQVRPWQPSPDNKMRGVVIWPDPEGMEITVTLYKGPKDKSYETKEWEFAVIDVSL